MSFTPACEVGLEVRGMCRRKYLERQTIGYCGDADDNHLNLGLDESAHRVCVTAINGVRPVSCSLSLSAAWRDSDVFSCKYKDEGQ